MSDQAQINPAGSGIKSMSELFPNSQAGPNQTPLVANAVQIHEELQSEVAAAGNAASPELKGAVDMARQMVKDAHARAEAAGTPPAQLPVTEQAPVPEAPVVQSTPQLVEGAQMSASPVLEAPKREAEASPEPFTLVRDGGINLPAGASTEVPQGPTDEIVPPVPPTPSQ
jgi:hypothetical protein